MKFRNICMREIAIYISAILYFSLGVAFSQAQPKPPTQKELDAMEAALKKLPTREQSEEFKKIGDDDTRKNELLNPEFDKLSRKIEQDTKGPGFQLTKAHVQAAMVNHKKLRDLYAWHIEAVDAWGHKSGRMNCVRQAEKMRLYMIRVSDQWLARVAALPLSTVEERLYAGQYVMTGGGGTTFQPDPEPVLDPKYMVGMELIGLGNVCLGGKEEYMLGTE